MTAGASVAAVAIVLAPVVVPAATVVAQNCAANPVLCVNQAGVIVADVGSMGGINVLATAGIGSTVAAKVAQRAGSRADIPTLSRVSKTELNAGVDDGMQYVQYQNETGWMWPADLGFQGPKVPAVLPVGTKLDRAGEPSGTFLSPLGTAFEQRALAPGTGASPVYQYEVLKDLPVLQGQIAPAFGQVGGGIQILPNFTTRVDVQWLLTNGYIRQIAIKKGKK